MLVFNVLSTCLSHCSPHKGSRNLLESLLKIPFLLSFYQFLIVPFGVRSYRNARKLEVEQIFAIYRSEARLLPTNYKGFCGSLYLLLSHSVQPLLPRFNFFNSRSSLVSLAACLLFRHFSFFCLSFCIACTLLRFRFYNFLQFDFFISLGSISISFPPSPSHIPFDLLSISFNLIVQLPISLPPSLSGVSLDGFILSITILARYLCDLSPCGA